MTIPAGSSFDFDTGIVGGQQGDVLFSGGGYVQAQGQASFGGNAEIASTTYIEQFMTLSLAGLEALSYGQIKALSYNPPGFLSAPAFNVLTSEGHYAKAIITALSEGGITIIYYTWESTNSSGFPVVMQVQNNYSFIIPGFPNYGIAPGSLFIIQGVNLSTGALSPLQSGAAPGLPLALNGTSVAVTVNGTTTNAPIYYTSPGQLGVILPSTTPAGTGTITVTNGPNPSSPVPIQVVPSALGLDSLYGTGRGPAVATDAGGNLLSFVHSASPNQTIVLWGSGVGADLANDDRTFPQSQNNLTSIPFQVFIGGIQAQVTYRGRSQYPGVDQINVVVPGLVTLGCYVSIQAMSGTMVSNTVTISVAQGGGSCSDPLFGVGPAQAQALASPGTVDFGSLSAIPTPEGSFWSLPSGQFGESEGSGPSVGSCMVQVPGSPSGATLPLSVSGLDVGTITATTASGSVALTEHPGGDYEGPLGGKANTGPVTFDNGPGGADVGHFNTTVTPIAAVTGSNVTSIASITQSQGVTVTWTGGEPGTLVQVQGGSSITVPAGWQYEPTFTCSAPSEAGQFTVPAAVLSAFSGTISLSVSTLLVESFMAPGLDWGYARVYEPGSNSNGTSISLK